MWIADGDDELLGEVAEPAPAGWTDDPRKMKARATQLAHAGNWQASIEIMETLYAQGMRYPLQVNLAWAYSRLGDLETAARWMSDALDDPSLPQSQPLPYTEQAGRGGFLEAYYQWSRGQAFP